MDAGGDRGRPPTTGGLPQPTDAPLGAPVPRAHLPPMSSSLGGLAALLAPLLPPPHGSGSSNGTGIPAGSSAVPRADTDARASGLGVGFRGPHHAGDGYTNNHDDEEEEEEHLGTSYPTGHSSALGGRARTSRHSTASASLSAAASGADAGARASIHEKTPLVSSPAMGAVSGGAVADTSAGVAGMDGSSTTPPSGGLPGAAPRAHGRSEYGRVSARSRSRRHRGGGSGLCGAFGSGSSRSNKGKGQGNTLPSLRLGSEFAPAPGMLLQPSFQTREGILGLSADVIAYICGFLTEKELATLASTCHRLRHVVYLSVFWTSLDLAPFATKLNDKAVLRLLRQPRFRRLSSLSLSGCTALTDRFLARLPELCPRLSQLTLTHCYNFSPDVILGTATSLPSLLRLGIPGGPAVAAVVAQLLDVARARGICLDLGLNWLRYCAETGRSTDMSPQAPAPRCRHAPDVGPDGAPRAPRDDARPRTPCWGAIKGRLLFSCVAGRDTLPSIFERPPLPAIRGKTVGTGTGAVVVAPAFPANGATDGAGDDVLVSAPAYARAPAPRGGEEDSESDIDDPSGAVNAGSGAGAGAVVEHRYRGHASDSDDDDDDENEDDDDSGYDHYHHHHHHHGGDHEAVPHEHAGDGSHFPSGVAVIDVPADTAPIPHSELRPGLLDALAFLSDLGRRTAPLNHTASSAYDAAVSKYSSTPGAFLHDVPPRGGPFPVRVSYYCVAHEGEDNWDPELKQCFNCNRIFDTKSMFSDVHCHFCHDIITLGTTSSWVWLPGFPDTNPKLTDIIGKLVSVDDVRHLPRTLRSYGVYDLTVNRTAHLAWHAPADAVEREWRARVDIFGREQARLAAASPVPAGANGTGRLVTVGTPAVSSIGEEEDENEDEAAALLSHGLSRHPGPAGSSSVGPRRPAFMTAGDGVELTDLGVLSPRYTPRTTGAVQREQQQQLRQRSEGVELSRLGRSNPAPAPAPATAVIEEENEDDDAAGAVPPGHRRRPSAHGLSLPGRFVATHYMTREEAAARGMVRADNGAPILISADDAAAAATATAATAGAGSGVMADGEVPVSALLAANSDGLDTQMTQIVNALRRAKEDGRERALLVVDKHHMVRVMADDHHIMTAEAEESLARVDRVCPSLWYVLLPFFVIMTLTLYFMHAYWRNQNQLPLEGTAAATYYLDLDAGGNIDTLTLVLVLVVVFVAAVALLLCLCVTRCRAACASIFRGVVAVEVFIMVGAGVTTMIYLFAQDVGLPLDAITFSLVILNVTALAVMTMYLDRVSQSARRVGLVLMYLVFPVVLASSLPSVVLYIFLGCICLIDIVAMSVEHGRNIAPVLVPATFQLLYERPRVLYSVEDTRLRAGDFIWFAFVVAIADAQRIMSTIMAFIAALSALAICVFGLPYLGVECRPLVFAFVCLIIITVCVPDIFAPFKDVVTAGVTGVSNFKT